MWGGWWHQPEYLTRAYLEELPKLEAERIQSRSIAVWLGNPSQTDDDASEKRSVLRDLERQANGGWSPTKRQLPVATPETLALMGVGFRRVTAKDLEQQQIQQSP